MTNNQDLELFINPETERKKSSIYFKNLYLIEHNCSSIQKKNKFARIFIQLLSSNITIQFNNVGEESEILSIL